MSEPETVRLEIESADVSSATVITSFFFTLVPDPECPEVCEPSIQLRTADTTTVQLPFRQTYNFTPRLQVFIQTFPPAGQGATMSMRVFIDDEQWYNDFRALQPVGADGEPENLQFVYQFAELSVQ